MRAKELEKFKKLLVLQKSELLNNTSKLIKEEAQHSPDDLADETDLAVSEVNQNLALRLRDRERVLLQKIELALSKIDDGTYGTCESCEEPIEPKRLEARPVATMCIACKEEQEHKEKVFAY
ncbi:MAG: TraR/DksA C4-type zinc finger protein [Oligoflexia bacterium]|nr:TraR/DksA C4-type zinc finger protein [Oligoflexia bacterium]